MLSSPPPSYTNRAQYNREHLNASPSKLRGFIKKTIFANDDDAYLKRLVNDVGGMDYVFRFLWWDGIMTSQTAAGDDGKTNVRPGRSWIQYCCFWNAHKCLKWILQEIVRHHLQNEQHQLLTSIQHESHLQQHDPNAMKDDHFTESIESSEEKQLKIVQQLLTYPSVSYCGTNYIAVATLRNSYQCLSILLEYGQIDPNMAINAHGSTAAHLAALKNHVQCLNVLESGNYACRFVGRDDNEGQTCVDENESQATNESIDNVLLREPPELSREAYDVIFPSSSGNSGSWKADWNIQNAQGDTVLHIAAREGSIAAMRFFLNTVTESAVKNEDRDVNVIDFSIRNKLGMDCIALAAMDNQSEIIAMISDTIEYLTKDVFDADGDEADALNMPQSPLERKMPQSPLHRKLPHLQPTPNRRRVQSDQPTPNRRRVQSEPYNNLAAFLPTPLKKEVRLEPLHRLSNSTLPRHFPSLNNRNPLEEYDSQTPLHMAAQFGHCEAIEALFESEYCDSTARDSLGQTALHIAASKNHLDACKMLVYLAEDNFQEFDVADVLGRTPLYIACLQGNESLASVLVSASNWRVLCHERKKSAVGPFYVSIAHQPPFHAAVVNNHLETVKVLIENGVDVNQTDLDGRTALSAAAKLGMYDMCQVLLSYGADVNKRSSRGGPTPFQKAKKYKHFDVANLLFEFGGQ